MTLQKCLIGDEYSVVCLYIYNIYSIYITHSFSHSITSKDTWWFTSELFTKCTETMSLLPVIIQVTFGPFLFVSYH